jgi:hypothetical protein
MHYYGLSAYGVLKSKKCHILTWFKPLVFRESLDARATVESSQ